LIEAASAFSSMEENQGRGAAEMSERKSRVDFVVHGVLAPNGYGGESSKVRHTCFLHYTGASLERLKP
jgi:hypothetical protein